MLVFVATLGVGLGRASAQTPPANPSPAAKPASDTGEAKQKKPSKLRSPDDGWLDVSGFLDQAYGFVPIAVPITEPAVGLGAAGALAFIGKPREGAARDAFDRPSITVVGGLGTENGTVGGFAADIRHWGNNRVQTVFGVVDASVNLDFYGTGETTPPASGSVSYNLAPLGGIAQVKYRLGGSRVWVGLNYVFARTRISFNVPDSTPGLPATPRESHIGGLTPSLTIDSRDALFTPGRGTYVEASAGLYGSALGGDDSFEKIGVVAMQYVPLRPRLTLGVRGDGGLTYGEPPFYMRPFVSLRGAPATRYQRDNLGQIETELRWQFWKRFSVVGFAGYAVAWNNLDTLDRQVTVTTGGGGFRYELARRYKLHMGADVAFGPDGPAFYIQFGSAWLRP